jgi:hypothetical protein
LLGQAGDLGIDRVGDLLVDQPAANSANTVK